MEKTQFEADEDKAFEESFRGLLKRDRKERQKHSEKLYRQTKLGRENHKRKNTKYRDTEKGREAARKAQQRYERSPKGIAKRKELNARAYQKRKAARLLADPRLAKLLQEKQERQEKKERQERGEGTTLSAFFKK